MSTAAIVRRCSESKTLIRGDRCDVGNRHPPPMNARVQRRIKTRGNQCQCFRKQTSTKVWEKRRRLTTAFFLFLAAWLSP